MGSTTRSAYVAWILVCGIWGTTYLAIRVALDTIPPSLVGGLRYAAAGAVLALLLVARGERLPPRATWPGLALLGFLMIGLGNGGVIWAEQWVPSGIAAMLVASVPFWTTALEAMISGGERITTRIACGLLTGFGGIFLLVWPDLAVGGVAGRRFAVGVLALQIACLGWSLGSVYSRRHARAENALGAAALQMLMGGLFMLAVATVRGDWSALAFSRRTAFAELYLTLVGSLAGYTAYVYALKHLPLSTVSLYAYVNPVVAVLLGTLLAAEPFGWRVPLAALIVLLGVVVVQGGRESERVKAPA